MQIQIFLQGGNIEKFSESKCSTVDQFLLLESFNINVFENKIWIKGFAFFFLFFWMLPRKINRATVCILSNDTFSWKDLENKGYIVIKILSSDFHKMSIYIAYMLISRSKLLTFFSTKYKGHQNKNILEDNLHGLNGKGNFCRY